MSNPTITRKAFERIARYDPQVKNDEATYNPNEAARNNKLNLKNNVRAFGISVFLPLALPVMVFSRPDLVPGTLILPFALLGEMAKDVTDIAFHSAMASKGVYDIVEE